MEQSGRIRPPLSHPRSGEPSLVATGRHPSYGVRVPPPPASLPPPGSEDVLYLVDLSGYVYRAYHAIAPLSSSKGETKNVLARWAG